MKKTIIIVGVSAALAVAFAGVVWWQRIAERKQRNVCIPSLYTQQQLADAVAHAERVRQQLRQSGIKTKQEDVSASPDGSVTLHLSFNRTVRDLSPLKSIPVFSLSIHQCKNLHDLSPLQDIPVADLGFTTELITNGIDVIRSMSSLQMINGMKPEEFWKKYDQGDFAGEN